MENTKTQWPSQKMGVQVALVVLLMFAGTVETEEGGVIFWSDRVILTCPEAGNWYGNKDDTELKSNSYTYEFQYDSKAKYRCVYPTSDTSDPKTTYQFYVEGKVCENCFELDAITFAVAMILDLTFTSVLMIVIYRCTKKKNPAAPSHSAPKAPARPGARPPPVPSVDYEPLNLNTRSQDTYSMVNRTG